MATTVARLQAILSADTSDFDSAMNRSETTMQRIGGGFQKAALPAAAALTAIGVGAKKAIDDASDLGEQMNKAAVVFGVNGKEVQQWSKGLVNSFGLSQRAALEAAGTYGNMLKPMGILPGKVKEISMNMVQLAGDMASFNNASPAETLDALRAGLAGETEPLRKFGVFLNEAAIQAEAVSSGIVKLAQDTTKIKQAQLSAQEAQRSYTKAVEEHGIKSQEAQRAAVELEVAENRLGIQLAGKVPKLNAAEKALATYQIITKSTKDAQGDFARTSESVANQQRIQAAETENLRAKMGQGLLPAYQAVQKTLIGVTGFLSEHTTTTKVAVGVVASLAAGVLAVNAGMALYRAATVLATVAQVAFNLALTANPIGIVIVALAALTAGVVIAYQKSETFRDAVDAVWAALRRMGGWIQENWGTISSIIQKAPIVVAVRAIAGAVDDVVGGLKTLIGWVKDAISWLEKLSKVPGIGRLVGDARDPSFNPFIGSAGAVVGSTGGINLMGANPEMMPFAVGAQGFGLQVTSGLRPGAITANGTLSDHARGKALDVAGSAFGMGAFFDSLIGNRAVKQAFYDPKGSIFGGLWNSYREGGHSDHVHVATYDKGGWIPPRSTVIARNNTPYWEPVGPPGRGAGNTYNFTVQGFVGNEHALARKLRDMIAQVERANGRRPFGNATAW